MHRPNLYYIYGTSVLEQLPKYNVEHIAKSTIYYNLDKLKKTGSTAHKKRSGRPKKITSQNSITVGQYIRRNSAISSRKLASKLLSKGVNVSYNTVLRHSASLGYDKKCALATPMLTRSHKKKRIEWPRRHQNDDWNRTVFTDET